MYSTNVMMSLLDQIYRYLIALFDDGASNDMKLQMIQTLNKPAIE